MAVKIRLKRLGKIRAPYYRIVVADSRTKRDGAVIEEIGKYHPTEEPSFIEVDSERAQYWLGVGAQPTEQVAAILKITGDWAKFKGEGDTAGTLKSAEAKTSAEDLIAEADKAAAESREGAKKAKEKEESDVTSTEGENTESETQDVEPGADQANEQGESTEDAEAQTSDEA
ncbi:30S ribosomal protein S16 [Brachybacterium sp. EF45031]|uniref:30S ribosomal protein S16 n=1 Tax=Brachybacterium sillae TaxID=2810536 RepID=UPI00217D4221|nr:30S ribosomal protein S16 [Brachybacterium sillae]MCS6712316.1 30S ribosomal protein S16 [Brachybacterium sillae]